MFYSCSLLNLPGSFQTDVVNGLMFHQLRLHYWVPQGSVVRAVLFTFFASPFARVIKKHKISCRFSAHDSQLHISTVSDIVPAALPEASGCYVKIQNWLIQNNL